jgi:hypothetical protein
MALVSSTEIRPTDITTFIEFSPLAAGVTMPTSTAAGFRCFYTSRPTKIMAMSVVSGNVTVGGVTYTAAYDVRAIDGTVTPVTTLNTALATTAVTAVASKAATRFPRPFRRAHGLVSTFRRPLPMPAPFAASSSPTVPCDGR